jgi:hypothetical protein
MYHLNFRDTIAASPYIFTLGVAGTVGRERPLLLKEYEASSARIWCPLFLLMTIIVSTGKTEENRD